MAMAISCTCRTINTFRTKSRHLIVAVITDKGWENLIGVLKDDFFNNPEFSRQPGRLANKTAIEHRLNSAFERETCEHWLEVLADARVPAAPVNEISHAFADVQALARNMKVRVPLGNGDSVEEPGNPIKLSETAEDIFTAPPILGEHTVQVLNGLLGLKADEIENLVRANVVQISK